MQGFSVCAKSGDDVYTGEGATGFQLTARLNRFLVRVVMEIYTVLDLHRRVLNYFLINIVMNQLKRWSVA